MYSKYNFGVVRALRRRLNLTLEELAKKSGLTYPTVASIETNKTLPSMKTLDALGGALEISASNLLALAERRIVQIRKAQGVSTNHRVKNQTGIDKLKVAYYDKGKLIRVRAKAGEKVHVMELHEECHEMCYMLSGTAELRIEDHTYKLGPDDTVLFDGVLDHAYTMIESGEFITIHIPKDIRVIETLLDSMDHGPATHTPPAKT
jgi:DNA-binding XRE family transcriptional regulator